MKLSLTLVFAVAVLSIASVAHAEDDASAITVTKPTKIGVKAGVSSTTLSQSGGDRDEGAIQRRLTVNAALFLTRRISDNVGLQFEAMISERGARIGSGADPTTIELRYALLPMLVRYELAPTSKAVRPFVMVGGSLGMLLSARNSGSSEKLDIRANLEELEFGGILSAGVEVPHRTGAISIEVRYSHGFSSVVKEVRGQVVPVVHNRVTSVLAGYSF